MTFTHQKSSRNGLFIQNYIKKRYHTSFAILTFSTLELTFWWPWMKIDLEDDLETLQWYYNCIFRSKSCSYLHLLKMIFSFTWPWNWPFDLEDDLEYSKLFQMRIAQAKLHEKEVLHMFLALFVRICFFSSLNLEIDFLTLKMTFNHENSTRNGLHSKNHVKMRYYTCS